VSKKLFLYTVIHLNLAYSSIEEEQRLEFIKRCYWPLLELIHEYKLPFGIEASGYTLEAAAEVDPEWVKELRLLTTSGQCEFIGSGYSQLIGPLVPKEVNSANLRLGHEVYEKILGFRPNIALVNEQAYSSGLIKHYLDAGYRAIIMEWDNPAINHPEWDSDWRYLPQFACSQNGDKIPLIWNKSIAFQKFQRYAHGDIELENYMGYLRKHLAENSRTMTLYGNDIEIFDCRPGRYHTEASLHEDGEWKRISKLFAELEADSRFKVIPIGDVLDLLHSPGGGNMLHLESAQVPVPVKKQEKYNITRWAITGRNDLAINTSCWQIYSALKEQLSRLDNKTAQKYWKELCFLWSSDFRTHITEKRWAKYTARLSKMLAKLNITPGVYNGIEKKNFVDFSTYIKNSSFKSERKGNFLTVETEQVKISLNCRRGCVIDALYFKELYDKPLIGTLYHGHYDDINLGADYYSGHSIVEIPGHKRMTDLNPTEPIIVDEASSNDTVIIRAVVPSELGNVNKTFRIYTKEQRVDIYYQFNVTDMPLCTFRTGIITMHPESFDRDTLYYRTHNGGNNPETFFLSGQDIFQGKSVSALISAKHGLGATEGWMELGDMEKSIRVYADRNVAAVIPMIRYCEVDDTFFYRLSWSAREIDETSKRGIMKTSIQKSLSLSVSFSIKPGKFK